MTAARSASFSPPRVLIAGGGVAALEAALALRAMAEDRVAVTLVADATHFTYRPLAVGASFGGAVPVRVDLAAVAAERAFSFQRGRVRGVDLERGELVLDAERLGFDHLVLALGARQVPVPGALAFRGPQDVGRLRDALAALGARGGRRRVVFSAPRGIVWTLPVYELALQTAVWGTTEGLDLVVAVAVPETAPLEVAGPDASAEVASLLDEHGIAFAGGVTVPRDDVAADLVVAVPALTGPRLPGLPADGDGFVPVDGFCRVPGARDVYAIGDMTARPVKQGGLATQQADVAAACIAAAAGAPVQPRPYEPVLRALLFTGERPRYLRSPEAPHAGPVDDGSTAPWWPPHKVVGAHLSPYLATHAELLEPVT